VLIEYYLGGTLKPLKKAAIAVAVSGLGIICIKKIRSLLAVIQDRQQRNERYLKGLRRFTHEELNKIERELRIH
jgi:hypothetical protein